MDGYRWCSVWNDTFHISSRISPLVSVVRVLVGPLASSVQSVCSVSRCSRSNGWPSSCGMIQNANGTHQPNSTADPMARPVMSRHIARTLRTMRGAAPAEMCSC